MPKIISEEDRVNIGKKMYWEYRFLFDFPETWKMIIGAIAIVPLVALILTSYTGELSRMTYFKALIISTLSSPIAGILHSYLYINRSPKKRSVFKINRSLAFSISSTIGFTFLLLMAGLFNAINPYLGLAIETYALGLLIGIPLITGYALTLDETFLGSLWKSFIIPIAIVLVDYFFYPEARIFHIPPLILIFLSFLLAGGTYLGMYIPLYLGKVGAEIDAIRALRGFFFSWFEKEHDILEDELSRISFERYIPMGIVKIKRLDTEKTLYLVTSYVHPGPLLDIGSSNLPFIMNRVFLSKTNSPAYELHGTCSHGENQPSKDDVYELIDALIETGIKINAEGTISDILQTKIGEFTYTAQRFGKYLLIIVTRSPKDFDDIALGVGMEVYGNISGKGLYGLLVDAHNSLSSPLAYIETKEGTEKALKIIRGTNKVIDEASKLEDREVFAGWSQCRCEQIKISEGLGPAGVMALVEKVNNKKFALVVLDANNLKSGMREKILEYLKSKDLIDSGEVVTTDTHSVNAHSPGKGAYPLMGEEQLDRLLPCIEKVVKESLQDMGPVRANGTVKMIRTRIIGRENVEKIVSTSGVALRVFLMLLPLIDIFVVLLNAIILSML